MRALRVDAVVARLLDDGQDGADFDDAQIRVETLRIGQGMADVAVGALVVAGRLHAPGEVFGGRGLVGGGAHVGEGRHGVLPNSLESVAKDEGVGAGNGVVDGLLMERKILGVKQMCASAVDGHGVVRGIEACILILIAARLGQVENLVADVAFEAVVDVRENGVGIGVRGQLAIVAGECRQKSHAVGDGKRGAVHEGALLAGLLVEAGGHENVHQGRVRQR